MLPVFAADEKKTPPRKTGTPEYKIGLYPPKGTNVPPEVRAELQAGVTALGKELQELTPWLAKNQPALLELLPDAQIFFNAVRYAIEDDMFYQTAEFKSARDLLAAGRERAAQLRAGRTPWTTATGNVVRGYVSKLDGSVQPYGLVVPATFKPGTKQPHRLDFWFHGRGDTLSELNFITGRMGEKARSQFSPAGTFVLHPYGRFMNAYKFAGEVDAFESLAHVQQHYPIDDQRISVRGFSMGGAAAWHLSAHHAGRWAAANPGAGFTEVWVYQNIAAKEPKPPWYEQKLWRLYDATDYAANFFNTTLVAYSGELDSQRQAADMMETALVAEGMKMTHIIGPGVEHKYEPKAQEHVGQLVDAAAAKGLDPFPKKVRFVLFSLRFNQMKWVTVDALEKHWERATVEAELDGGTAMIATRGIMGITLALPAGTSLFLDGKRFDGDPSVPLSFARSNGRWERGLAPRASVGAWAKTHGLQGPIDDAFMESFLFVKPTGRAMNARAGAWVDDEFAYATGQWRRQHRGEPRVKNDSAVSDSDIAQHNLILFGDPQSNTILAAVADQLPIQWTAAGIVAGGKTWAADQYAPAFIFPNPLNPKRYVVVNSGFTFALVGGASNSQQTPKLPDWAILAMGVPRSERLEKGVSDANFFDERWKMTGTGR